LLAVSSPLKVGLISLGCAKNLVDSEVMLGTLLRDGLQLTQKSEDADILLVNTCGFIEGAKQESIDTILKAIQHRDTGKCKAVIVAGCLAQRYPKDLQKEIPEVDAFIGLNEVPRISEIVREIMDKKSAGLYWSGPAKFVPDFSAPRFRLTPSHFAYIKIAEGCNHPCTFCSIPRIRGKHRSRQPDDVLAEVKSLVAGGVREINLISQDTTFYGKDLDSRRALLPVLLRSIQQISGDFWVRLLYTHPAHWTDELIATIAACDKVCRYVDIPLQHISDKMLETMRRETSGEYIRDLIRRIRAGIPGVAIRTAFIVGHPGETDADFDELLDFIKAARFERLGVFAYSQEDHTPAGNAEWQIPVRVRQQRRNKAMATQQQVSRDVLKEFVGKRLRVLVEKPDAGRSHIDAPEIDGKVLLKGNAAVGDFVDVTITGSKEYDLVGECR
jgi:ribosomal protein S12 methylthiotransferase